MYISQIINFLSIFIVRNKKKYLSPKLKKKFVKSEPKLPDIATESRVSWSIPLVCHEPKQRTGRI